MKKKEQEADWSESRKTLIYATAGEAGGYMSEYSGWRGNVRLPVGSVSREEHAWGSARVAARAREGE